MKTLRVILAIVLLLAGASPASALPGIVISTVDAGALPWTVYYDGTNLVWQRQSLAPCSVTYTQFRSAMSNYFNGATADKIVLRDALGNTATLSVDVTPTNLTILCSVSGGYSGTFTIAEVNKILAFLSSTT